MTGLPATRGRLLSQEDFASGRHVEMIARSGLLAHMELTPEEDRLAAMEEMIAAAAGPMVWVFGYGSLIWNPAFRFDERRAGTLHGYHRSYCFWSTVGRGTPDAPGMMLGLDRGGSCRGLVMGVRRERAARELASVFMREMTGKAYLAKSLRVVTGDGAVGAVCFVADRRFRHYAGRLPPEEIARHVARGHGHLGPCSDYLFNTSQHLDAWGLPDPKLHELCRLVRRRIGDAPAAVTPAPGDGRGQS